MPSMLGLVRRDADEIRELRPRTALGANSPTYIGAIIEATPTAMPPIMR